MRYLVDLFGGSKNVTEVTAGQALGLALLDLDSGKVPRSELIHSARVYELDQDGDVLRVVPCALEEGNAA
jgi:hypothetical protein